MNKETKTIAQQIKWDFEANGDLEILNKNGNEIYYEVSSGLWYKREYDSKGKCIYYETSDGFWVKKEYDSKGKEIYYETSDGYWYKKEYNSKGNQIYYENSNGEIIDNRPKNEITIDVSGIENSGKSRVVFLLKKLLKEQKFDVQFDGGRDFDDESHFDEYIENRFDGILENINPITKIVIKESHTKPSKT